jgi:hypothetical protein
MRITALALLISLIIPTTGDAAPVDLNSFLPEIEEAAKPNITLRADGTLTTVTPEGTKSDQITIIHRESNDLLIEVRQGMKVLLLKGGAEAFSALPGVKEATAMKPDATLGTSEFAREDLQPFVFSRYTTPRIVDQTSQAVHVALFPKESQYSLVVITFDREKKVPVKTMYYQQTLNNLVKMRRDHDHVLIGRRWLPTRVTMEHFAMRNTSTLELRWSQAPDLPPELFQPAFLQRASNFVWPAAPTPAAP